MTHRLRHLAGFTLIEMIMVIVITGVIAGMVAVFITTPVQGYVDSVRRAELTDQADVALRRISRDVRRALPNSLREVTANRSFEFILTKSGGRYRDASDGSTDPTPLTAPDCDSSPTPGLGPCFLNFTTAANTSFDVLGTMPDINVNDHVVVYNLTTSDAAGQTHGNAYVPDNRARVSAILGNTVTLASNPFASQSPPLPSPSARFQVIDQNEQVVRYTCDGTNLTRATVCSLDATGCTATSALLAGGGTTTAACPIIDYTTAAIGRSGLLYISLTLRDTSGEQVTLFQQIHVDNSP